MRYVERIGLLDAVVLLRDRLNEMYEAEQVPKGTYNRKLSLRHLVRAVNKADRSVSTVRKPLQTVALFVPKQVHLLPLDKHKVFSGERAASITQSSLMNLHPSAIDVFINEQPWIELTGIESEFISVYKEHHTHELKPERTIRRVSDTSFASSRNCGTICSYDTNRRILRIDPSFADDVYLVFEGYVQPGLIDVNDIDEATVEEAEDTSLRTQRLFTPPHFEDLLIRVALSKLLPLQADPVNDVQIEELVRGQDHGNGASFIVPEGMYSHFGEW